MPFIHTITTEPIPAEKERAIKAQLGRAIELIPGKDEAGLMLAFTDSTKMWLGGDNSQPTAFVEIRVFGHSDPRSYDAVTAEVCRIMTAELGIPGERTYVRYEEGTLWGRNGVNF